MRPVSNPPNPWLSAHVEWLDEPPLAGLQVFAEESSSALTKNDSPDVGFTWSVNPYRGCYHACAYCYARPTHQYLGFGAGTDFDLKVVVKTNVAELLATELARRSWRREVIAFSGVTDCYQPLEASYGLTRRCLEVCLDARNPVAVITKSSIVRRDRDLLARLARGPGASVHVSIPFASDETGRKLEPFAPLVSQRFLTVRMLAAAGIPTGVLVAPMIPGLSDRELPEILARARDAGASSAALVLLRLPAEVLPVFEERLRQALPGKADAVMSALVAMRGGEQKNESRFGARMSGVGPRWEIVEQLFDATCRRLGLVHGRPDEVGARSELSGPRQRTMFD
jgi:DNA repair photolyase